MISLLRVFLHNTRCAWGATQSKAEYETWTTTADAWDPAQGKRPGHWLAMMLFGPRRFWPDGLSYMMAEFWAHLFIILSFFLLALMSVIPIALTIWVALRFIGPS